MVVRMRTNVIRREEKGFGPVSFPRVLMAGFAGAFGILTIGKIFGNIILGCGLGIFLGAFVIFMTQPVGGTPMAQHLVKSFRGLVIVNAVKQERGESASGFFSFINNLMSLDPAEGILECDEVFSAGNARSEDDIDGFVFFQDLSDDGSENVEVISHPFGEISN